jgi:hypothetical protein
MGLLTKNCSSQTVSILKEKEREGCPDESVKAGDTQQSGWIARWGA